MFGRESRGVMFCDSREEVDACFFFCVGDFDRFVVLGTKRRERKENKISFRSFALIEKVERQRLGLKIRERESLTNQCRVCSDFDSGEEPENLLVELQNLFLRFRRGRKWWFLKLWIFSWESFLCKKNLNGPSFCFRRRTQERARERNERKGEINNRISLTLRIYRDVQQRKMKGLPRSC